MPKWYSPEGDLQSAGADNYTQVDAHSVKVSFVVAVTEHRPNQYVVTVTPHTWQYVCRQPAAAAARARGSEPAAVGARPRRCALRSSIYDRAKGYAMRLRRSQ